ncbi:MAG TPA: hypothetical protein V6C65_14770, partial [Allocoleopsis sp.]
MVPLQVLAIPEDVAFCMLEEVPAPQDVTGVIGVAPAQSSLPGAAKLFAERAMVVASNNSTRAVSCRMAFNRIWICKIDR